MAVLPKVITDPEMPKVADMLERVRALGVREALVSHLGHIALARRFGLEVRGDTGMNLENSYSLAVAEKAGLLSVTAPVDLRMEQIKGLCKPVDVEMILYGRVL